MPDSEELAITRGCHANNVVSRLSARMEVHVPTME